MSAWEQAVREGARLVGEVERAPSLAVLQLDRTIAWSDFEDALERHEPEAAAQAARAWCDAWARLLEVA